MSDTAYVATLPDCQLCGGPTHPAAYDVSLAAFGDSRWGYVCETVYASMGSPPLGTGRGQRLTTDPEPTKSRAEVHEEIMTALDNGDFEAAFDAVGDGDVLDFL